MVTVSYKKNGATEQRYFDSDKPEKAYMEALQMARKLAYSGTYAEITITRG